MKRYTEVAELTAELHWCIENGSRGPRTEAALRWALEAIEDVHAGADAEAQRVVEEAERERAK